MSPPNPITPPQSPLLAHVSVSVPDCDLRRSLVGLVTETFKTVTGFLTVQLWADVSAHHGNQMCFALLVAGSCPLGCVKIEARGLSVYIIIHGKWLQNHQKCLSVTLSKNNFPFLSECSWKWMLRLESSNDVQYMMHNNVTSYSFPPLTGFPRCCI